MKRGHIVNTHWVLAILNFNILLLAKSHAVVLGWQQGPKTVLVGRARLCGLENRVGEGSFVPLSRCQGKHRMLGLKSRAHISPNPDIYFLIDLWWSWLALGYDSSEHGIILPKEGCLEDSNKFPECFPSPTTRRHHWPVITQFSSSGPEILAAAVGSEQERRLRW